MERADSSSSVLVFPSSSPSSDGSDIATPHESPSFRISRVIDENYDEGREEYIQEYERNQHKNIIRNVLHIDNSMNPDQMLDRIAESLPHVWNVVDKDEERSRRISLTLRGPPMPNLRPQSN